MPSSVKHSVENASIGLALALRIGGIDLVAEPIRQQCRSAARLRRLRQKIVRAPKLPVSSLPMRTQCGDEFEPPRRSIRVGRAF